jgi:hypothetical protein
MDVFLKIEKQDLNSHPVSIFLLTQQRAINLIQKINRR